jgi:hypothetical protein
MDESTKIMILDYFEGFQDRPPVNGIRAHLNNCIKYLEEGEPKKAGYWENRGQSPF